MFLVLIGVIITLYGFINYKKAFMLFLVYQVFWYYNAPLFSIGGKTLTASTGFTLIFFIMYFFYNHRLEQPRIKCPYMVPLLLVVFSAVASCFTSQIGFTSELTRTLSITICPNVIVVWLMWNVIETKKDFFVLFKMLTVTMCLAAIFAVYEYSVQDNFLFNIKDEIEGGLSNYNNTLFNESATMRGYRIYSFFEHPVGAGMCFGIYFAFVVTVVVKAKEKLPYQKLAIITALLCLPCVVFTKMRSVIVFAFLACLGFIDFKKTKFYQIILLMGIGVAIAWPLISPHINLLLSIFDSKYSNDVGGSNLAMRLSQLEAVIRIMNESPISGLGVNITQARDTFTAGALAFESVWFEQMAQHGLIGVATTIVSLIYSIIVVPKRFNSKELVFFALAYWVTYTITCIPSFRLFLLYFVYFYFIKTSDSYLNQKEEYKRLRFVINR